MQKNPYKKPDAFTKAAKKQGFPARSVFKLEEIDQRCRLLKHGQRVVDLGAAPGSWSLFVQKKIGPNGRLVAVDRLPLTVTLVGHARVHLADLYELSDDAFSVEAPFDVVLSDMAPNTSGMRDIDQYQSYELVMKALDIANRFARKGSSLVAKIFMGPDYEKARAAFRKEYVAVRTLRPEPVRTNSIELFLVATDKRRGPPDAVVAPIEPAPPVPTTGALDAASRAVDESVARPTEPAVVTPSREPKPRPTASAKAAAKLARASAKPTAKSRKPTAKSKPGAKPKPAAKSKSARPAKRRQAKKK